MPLEKIYLIIAFTLISSFVFADDTVYSGDGIDIFPIRSNDIQLVSEVIKIVDYNALNPGKRSWRRWRVHVDMVFKNHGPDSVVQMGFPLFTTYDDVGKTSIIDPQFRTWVNGEEVKVQKKRGVPNPAKDRRELDFSDTVYAYPVEFKKDEMKRITHSYGVGGSFDSMGGGDFKYILLTGALWKGVIEDFSMQFETHTSEARYIIGTLPKEHNAQVKGNRVILTWHFKNFEPDADFEIVCGSSMFPLVKRSIDELIGTYMRFYYLNDARARYAKNKVFASYGYPFKNPFVHAQFYYPGSPYKLNPGFNMENISQEHLDFIELLKNPEEHSPDGKEEKKWFCDRVAEWLWH